MSLSALFMLIMISIVKSGKSMNLHSRNIQRLATNANNIKLIPTNTWVTSRSKSTKLNEGSPTRDGLGKPKGYANLKAIYKFEHETITGLPDLDKPFLVLGIESSCDDTGVAIVKSDGTILSNIVYSQNEVHEQFGGIVPSLAMEAHKSNIDKAVEEAVSEAGLNSLNEIDAIAVTKGPGLEICLRVGLRKAQEISTKFKKPFVTVHHLEAHCMMARLAGKEIIPPSETPKTPTSPIQTPLKPNNPTSNLSHLKHFTPKVEFPFLVLLASGGHTSILLCKEMGDYTVLGGTLDDALGEAFDKAARMLGLTVEGSGGATIEKMAKIYSMKKEIDFDNSENSNFTMTVPMREKQNCDFSYAGLKNQFRMQVERARSLCGLEESGTNAPKKEMEAPSDIVIIPEEYSLELCAKFQDVAFTHVEDRVKRALDYVDSQKIKLQGLVVVGGVAANMELRRRLFSLIEQRTQKLIKIQQEQLEIHGIDTINPSLNLPLIFPPPKLCTDNGVMAAWTGIEKLSRGVSNDRVTQEPIARWPLGTPVEGGHDVFSKRNLDVRVK